MTAEIRSLLKQWMRETQIRMELMFAFLLKFFFPLYNIQRINFWAIFRQCKSWLVKKCEANLMFIATSTL
jgi:hypothetical protein